MIYVTGDTHGYTTRFISGQPDCIYDVDWKSEDILIVAGDFGFIFSDTYEERDFLDWLENEKPYTIAFVDGNHENHPKIAEFPEENWYGGRIHRIRKNIIHLMRGQVYLLENNKKIFTMGGAYSIDVAYRRNYFLKYGSRIHWEEELPNEAEYKEAIENLKKHDFQIDYVITHTAPKELILHMGYTPDPHDYELTGFLDYVMYQCKDSLKRWFYGHWHLDEEFYDGKFKVLLNDVDVLD